MTATDRDGRTYRCPDCGRQITIGTTGVEYGHERGKGESGAAPRCPRRPDCVDPVRETKEHDEWCTGDDQEVSAGA